MKARISLRDTQKRRVYSAEREALRASELGKINPDIEVWQRYANKVLKVAAIRRRTKAASAKVVVVAHRANQVVARARPSLDGRWTISLPMWGRNKFVVLHELAHVLTPQTEPSHGWAFCRTLLWLVRFAEGKDNYKALKHSFIKHRVRFKPKKRRAMTAEQKEALRQRFIAMKNRLTQKQT